MEEEYLKLLRLFNEEGVEYVVAGGFAVAAHGYPRFTDDLDLFVRPTRENAERVHRATGRFGCQEDEFAVADVAQAAQYFSFARNDSWFDVMTSLAGVTFDECWQNHQVIEVAGVPVRFISLGALRKAKAATARPQDLLDLENLPPSP